MSTRTQTERSEATRGALIDAGRRLFAERGYADVGTEEIVRAAGVTRGALYHHFDGKRDLLRAVYEQIESEIAAEVAAAVTPGAGALETLSLGAEMFLDHCLEPEVQRIVLLDAPAVLGWEEWREIGARYGLGLIEGLLTAGMESGEIRRPAGRAALACPARRARRDRDARRPRRRPKTARAEAGETIQSCSPRSAPNA